MLRFSYIVAVGAIATVVAALATDAAADCRRVCRPGEVRDVMRCCVKPARKTRIRLSDTALCKRHKRWASCVREGARRVRLQQFDRVRELLLPVCNSSKAPARLRQRACLRLAKLIYTGRVKHIGIGDRYRRARWLMRRGCAGANKPAACGDADRDGIPDNLDSCPKRAEDKDGHDDHDGCPDLDDDGDGVADTKDRCPALWAASASGCPRPGVRLGNAFLFEFQSTVFNPDNPIVHRRLLTLIDMVKRNPNVGIIEVRGHARKSDTEAKKQVQVSRQRAYRIYQWLVAHGIPKKRIRWFGYGSRLYNSQMADVVVATPLHRRLTKQQRAHVLKQLHALTEPCRRISVAGDGKGRFVFDIATDGSAILPIKVSGSLAGTPRARCVRHRIRKFLFPRSRSKNRMVFELVAR